MKVKALVTTARRTLGRTALKLQKYSPEIMAVAGTVGVITTTVMACKATTKLSGILEEAKDDIDTIHEAVEHADELPEEYTVEDSKKDLVIVYAQTGIKLVKLYGPSVILGAASLGCLLGSNNILRKRYLASAAAYTTIEKGFKEYRGRVVERFGEDLDRELKYNIRAKEIEEMVTNEDGTEQPVKRTATVMDDVSALLNPGSRFFDEYCKGFVKNAEANLTFLRQQEHAATIKFKDRGHMFLNEVYDMLGMDRTKEGNILGWIYDEKNPLGDNFIDFGIYKTYGVERYDERKRAFVNGKEHSVLLDFNIHGNILELI